MSESKQSLKRKRIRQFFLSFATHPKEEAKEEEVQYDLIETGLTYKQMRLPIEKITPKFVDNLRNSIEHNFLRAKIRKATEDDLESIVKLHNRAWLTSHTPFSPLQFDSLKTVFKFPDTEIFVAQVYGQDAAFIICDLEGPNKEIGIIAGLGVIPRFQRKGLGTVLGMAAWDYFLKKKSITEIRCEVYIGNTASYNFIKSIGFEEFGMKTYTWDDLSKEDVSS